MNPDNPSDHAGDFAGEVAVVTGGSGALCSPMALALGQRGAAVVVVAHSRMTRARAVASQIVSNGGRAIAVQADVLDRESLEHAREKIREELGEIDMLINGAGGNSPKATTALEEITGEELDQLENGFFGLELDGFQKVFDLNFTGTLLPTMVFTKDMVLRQKGVVLNVSSMNAYKPLTKIPAYSAAKASINNFTEWLAVHFAKVGVRVNAIAPGFFLTEQNRFLLTDERTGELTLRGRTIIDHTPMARFGHPGDLIGTVLWLLSSGAAFVHGVVVPVDGGFSAFSGV